MLFHSGWILIKDFFFLTWLVALSLTVGGTVFALRSRRRRPGKSIARPGISILKPLKGLDPGIRENLESFFRLQYQDWELIFSVNDGEDLVVPLVRQIMAKYPKVKARIVVGAVPAGINPKVNNLIRPFAMAANDWVLISDSNTRVDPEFLNRLVIDLEPRTALKYCVVTGEGASSFGARLDSIAINTFYARGTWLGDALKFPCVTGKAMLMRKSALEALGGIEALAPEVAEDFVIGQAFHRLGYGVMVSLDPIRQFVGRCTFSGYWARTVRWGRIRKMHAPKIVFLCEPLLTSIGSGVTGAIAMRGAFGTPCVPFFFAHLALWWACDRALMFRMGQIMDWRSFGAWLARELLHPVQWAHIALGSKVEWRGSVLKMERSGVLERIASFDRQSTATRA